MFFLEHPPMLAVQLHWRWSCMDWDRRGVGCSWWGSPCSWNKCRPRVEGRFHLWFQRGCGMGPRLWLSFNPSCLEARVQSRCPVLQLFEGSPFLLSSQEILDRVLQSSVKVEDQGIAIHLHMLAMPDESCVILCHRCGLADVAGGRDGIPFNVRVSKQGS